MRKNISIGVDDEALEALDARVVTEGTNRSAVIRSLITGAGHPTGYVWVAYYPDYSGFVPFGLEVDALRHAVTHSMEVIRVPFGASLSDAIESKRNPQR